jgi:hypothetical protein
MIKSDVSVSSKQRISPYFFGRKLVGISLFLGKLVALLAISSFNGAGRNGIKIN